MTNINKKKPFYKIFNFQKKSKNIQKFTICFFEVFYSFLFCFQ